MSQRQWYIVGQGKNYGPYTVSQLKQFAAEGKIQHGTAVIAAGMAKAVSAKRAGAFAIDEQLPPRANHTALTSPFSAPSYSPQQTTSNAARYNAKYQKQARGNSATVIAIALCVGIFTLGGLGYAMYSQRELAADSHAGVGAVATVDELKAENQTTHSPSDAWQEKVDERFALDEEHRRIENERARLAEERRLGEVRLAEERRLALGRTLLAEQRRLAEESRLAEQHRIAEERNLRTRDEHSLPVDASAETEPNAIIKQVKALQSRLSVYENAEASPLVGKMLVFEGMEGRYDGLDEKQRGTMTWVTALVLMEAAVDVIVQERRRLGKTSLDEREVRPLLTKSFEKKFPWLVFFGGEGLVRKLAESHKE